MGVGSIATFAVLVLCLIGVRVISYDQGMDKGFATCYEAFLRDLVNGKVRVDGDKLVFNHPSIKLYDGGAELSEIRIDELLPKR